MMSRHYRVRPVAAISLARLQTLNNNMYNIPIVILRVEINVKIGKTSKPV